MKLELISEIIAWNLAKINIFKLCSLNSVKEKKTADLIALTNFLGKKGKKKLNLSKLKTLQNGKKL